MKKKYVKPAVLIENFEVNEFIAGACSENGKLGPIPEDIRKYMNQSSIYACVLDDGSGKFVFSDNCLDVGGEDLSHKDDCYQAIIGMYLNS